MITQVPAFERGYFKIGEAVHIFDKDKGKSYDGLFLDYDLRRICFVIVEYSSPMCGSAGCESKKLYINIDDVMQEKYKIEKV